MRIYIFITEYLVKLGHIGGHIQDLHIPLTCAAKSVEYHFVTFIKHFKLKIHQVIGKLNMTVIENWIS